eukprot:TRINITY_DN495_c0_g1_i1.p7 TRINITY_DN495_c0_g1~~TRINITY_DN495_c0_g1_i1.p7  ORF type:complete len:274 (-),score=68.92 TRINITY_DN495_c0_g1_i1:7644-8465(-)
MQKHYNEQLNLLIEAKQEEERERKAQEAAKKKREAEKPKEPEPEKPKGARVEEVTEEEAKKIAEKPAEPAKTEEEEDKEPPPPGNGGKTDKYVWTQTLNEVTLNIPIPPNIRAKMLDVVFGQKKIKVGIKGQPPIIDGEFPERIKVRICYNLSQPDDALWTLEETKDGKVLCITVEKFEGMHWWDCAIAGDPKIDTKKIRPEDSKLADLDPETRATVEKMMFDQQQKAKGMPTSDEMKKQEMLKKFMEAHPEMDFSKAKISQIIYDALINKNA